jgi:hypothetical protein
MAELPAVKHRRTYLRYRLHGKAGVHCKIMNRGPR